MTRFTIDKNWILELDDMQSRELIARLCRAEVARINLGACLVTSGGNQRAADGGVDVNVEHFASTANGRVHLSVGGTVFQVKAENNFGPSRVEAEMRPKGVIRDFFTELNRTSGAYLIASTNEDLALPALKKRLTRMRTVLKAEGLTNVQFGFLDAQQLADWVERHISVQIWMRQILNHSLSGWHPYGPWATGETDIDAIFRMDDLPRIMPPSGKTGDDRLTLAGAIEDIRDALVCDTGNQIRLRLVGLSGVGKTRLVQALFDERIDTGVMPSSDQVIYTDVGIGSTPTPHEMVAELMTTGEPATIIVDNCGSDTHSQLVELMKQAGPDLRLLTIEFDIQDDLPVGTHCYQMEASSPELLVSLLSDRFTKLNQVNARRIATLSDGNARIAIAIADSVKNTNNVGELRDAQLFNRLFSQRSQNDTDELKRAAEATSLVYSFNVGDDSDEITRLAGFAELSTSSFRRHITKLEQRGIIQRRGDFRALLPHALANRIAREALSSLTPQELYDDFFPDTSVRLAKSFAHRLSYLHTCAPAVQISDLAFTEGGVCSDTRALNEDSEQIFRYLASTNPNAAIGVIERAVGTGEPIRHDIGRLLFNLAYDETTFDRTAAVLAKLSTSEKGGINSNDPRKLLATMYQLHFSGTMAETPQKLTFLERMLDPLDLNRSDLVLDCLDSGLKSNHFSSGNIFEFGSRSRSYGWMPETWGTVAVQYSAWVNKLIDIAITNKEFSKNAREILANRFRGLWSFSLVRPYLVEAINRLLDNKPWPEGYRAAQETLGFDGDTSDIPDARPLRDLILSLTPQDLITRVQINVIVANVRDEIIDINGDRLPHEESMIARAETAISLGEEIGIELDALSEVRPDMISKTNMGLTEKFGIGVGNTILSISDELERARVLIADGGAGLASYSYALGLIKSWKENNPAEVLNWLNEHERDPVWRYAVPWIVDIIGINETNLARLISLLAEDEPPINAFGSRTFKRLTESLPITDQRRLYDALVGSGTQGALNALDQIEMAVHGQDPIDPFYKNEMLDFLLHFPWGGIGDGNDHMDYGIGEIFKKIVKGCLEASAIEFIEKLSIKPKEEYWYFDDPRKKALREMFRYFPELCLPRLCVPDEDGTYGSANALCGSNPKYHEGLIEVVPDDVLLQWIDQLNPKNRQACVEFVARTCRVLECETDGMREPKGFRPLASEIAERADNPATVLEIFADCAVGNFFVGSFAAHIRTRKKFFKGLKLDGRPETKAGLNNALAYLDRKIALEQGREDENARVSAERFE